MVRRRLSTALAALGLMAAASVAHATVPGGNDPALVVGVVAELSGPDAMGPQDVVDGFRLGMKQMAQRLANQEARVVVVDAKDSADSAVEAVKRMVDRDQVDFVLTALSPSAFAAVLPTLVKSKTFVLNLGEAPPSLAGAGCSAWVFDLVGAQSGIDEAAGVQLGLDQIRRLAVVAPPDSPLSKAAIAALKRTFPGEVVGTIVPRHGATTFTRELTELARLAPDAVYDLLGGGINVEFMRALDASGLRPHLPVYAPWPAFSRTYLPAMGDAAADVVTVGNWAPDIDNPQNHRLVSDFEAEFGRPATTWAAFGYDAAALLDTALQATKGRTSDSEALRNTLRHAEFASVRGVWHFNTNQGPVQSLLSRKVGRDGKGRASSETSAVVVRDWRDPAALACPMRWDVVPPPPVAKKPPPPAHPPRSH